MARCERPSTRISAALPRCALAKVRAANATATAESKAASDNYRGGNFGGQAAPSAPTAGGSGSADGFMNIPDGLEEELPFS